MAWILTISSLILIWISSLCKIFQASWSPMKNSFLTNGGALQKRNVLLVIAHPDDESMFFTPTIGYLTSRGHNIHILCLSIGNADGKGSTRKLELHQACTILKVPVQNAKVLDHPDLQDGFGKVWNHTLLAKIIEDEMISHGINLIITFDDHGVSGHCNHRDVHFGVSTNIFRKYSGPIDIWCSILYAMWHHRGLIQCLLNEHPERSYFAMAQHLSQWVWFRKLFVALSSYTYVNTLRKMT
ncbi:N-acetylglucosaminyl-phosphatidylinositol de-N-acetylase [Quillaja saponaria]|uniref:N-acetylglucosaminylphosphatidylinositol deacetylase n=1 Tax=Quillaja saponaria TaxID=32244 RepID=A0AAD7PX23_QUISA|nr:N-acetylglucosaminyl-phosphatidylinositol de-N-acetylase [Quillaja saponaria]